MMRQCSLSSSSFIFVSATTFLYIKNTLFKKCKPGYKEIKPSNWEHYNSHCDPWDIYYEVQYCVSYSVKCSVLPNQNKEFLRHTKTLK